MARSDEPVFRIGEYWLAKRPGKETWNRTWYDPDAQCTRRISLGTTELEEAKQRLSDWYVREHAPQDETPEEVSLADVIRRYYEEHASKLRSHETARLNLLVWLDFFGANATVASATKAQEIDRFIEHLKGQGKSPSYINRILTTGRAAINRAWKKGILTAAPFIRSEKVGDVQPKGRPLSMDELRLFYHSAEAPHLKAYILWALGTAGRPEAVLDIHSSLIDLDHGLVQLNPPGREQTKKYRPTVKLPDSLRPFIVDGFQITFRGKRCNDIKTSWRIQRANCGFDKDVNPYSLRHTIARHMRASSVPAWEVSAQLGHKKKELSTTEIYAPFDPAYLNKAVAAIDLFLQELLVSTDERPLISCTPRVHDESGKNADRPEASDFIGNFGAGDEIRTHDPNLGKVVLYP